MSKSYNQKLKILYILKMLTERSDEMHPLTTKQLITGLEQNGIKAERKSIYDDIAALVDFGVDIIQISGRNGGYYLGEREFELPELKLLVDAVQASKFVTTKKSRELIHKLETLTSQENAKQLSRQVVVADRTKAVNETIYYNVDKIHEAIGTNKQIVFQYFTWTVDKTMELKNDGKNYEVSPWLLSWDDENYYMIAYDNIAKKIKHFRVDKMLHIVVKDEMREGKETFDKFDVAGYTKKTFGMFAGEEETVILICANYLIGVMIDRFGMDAAIRKETEESFRIRVKVAVSPQFFGWLTGLGSQVKIAEPMQVRDKYECYLQEIMKNCTT